MPENRPEVLAPTPLMLLVAVYLPPRALDSLGMLIEERTVHTPFGDVGPVALRRVPLLEGGPMLPAASGLSLWLLPYSGLPTRTDPRATLFAAHALGVRRVLAWDLGFALNHALHRGQTAIATDAVDLTRHQPDTFSNTPGLEAALRESEETATFCPAATSILHDEYPLAPPALVVGVDGPRRETPAEARMARAWGGDLLCHNITPEAMLARELGLCFGALVTVGDYSRDQARAAVEGEVRKGMEWTMQRLPAVLARLAGPRTCLCGA